MKPIVTINVIIWLLSKSKLNGRLCTGGELLDRVLGRKFFSEEDAAHVMRQLLSAVAYCHSRKVAHRDLKLENLLFSSHDKDAALKIADFGMATNCEVEMTTRIGTPLYIAPEVLTRSYTEKCDVWSCGVILYMLLSGLPPFVASSEVELYQKIQRGIYSLTGPRWNGVTKGAIDLLQNMMMRDPKKRFSALEALNHPWIQGNCIDCFDYSEAKTLLTELTAFRTEYKLQQAALLYIVSQLLSDKEKMKVHSLFLSLDKNMDGKLSIEELMQGYKDCFGEDYLEEAKLRAIIQKADVAGNGCIELTEFVMATINKKKILSTKRLIAAFKIFDTNGDGMISADELKYILGKETNVANEDRKSVV